MNDAQFALKQKYIHVGISHSADLLFELTMATLSSSWQGTVPLTDTLPKVELVSPHSGRQNPEGPGKLPLHVVQVAVHTNSSCFRFHMLPAIRAAWHDAALSAMPVRALTA